MFKKLVSLMLKGVFSLLALVGAPYLIPTGTGSTGESIGTTFSDLAESFLSNFVLVIGYAIPLIVVYVIIRLVKGYVGR